MMPPIGQRIRTIRNARGLSMQQLAAAIGRELRAIASIERGQGRVKPPRLEVICAALGVTVEDIQSDNWRKLCARGVSLEEAL